MEVGDGSSGFGSAFVDALGMIFATEIGDKTFFIAAILAMQQPRLVVFTGAISALVVMTVLSTIFGHLVPHLLPPVLTHYASVLLFVYFGCRMLWSAIEMYRTGEGTGVSEEMEEVEHELREKGLADDAAASPAGKEAGEEYQPIGRVTSDETAASIAEPEEVEEGKANGAVDQAERADNPGAGGCETNHGAGGANGGDEVVAAKSSGRRERPSKRKVLVQAFILTFLAEWGDRSQIATIVLAAAQDAFGVTLGACIGHSVCTGMAVLGGRLLASRISERQVSLGGGVLFIIFALIELYMGPPEHHKAIPKPP